MPSSSALISGSHVLSRRLFGVQLFVYVATQPVCGESSSHDVERQETDGAWLG